MSEEIKLWGGPLDGETQVIHEGDTIEFPVKKDVQFIPEPGQEASEIEITRVLYRRVKKNSSIFRFVS